MRGKFPFNAWMVMMVMTVVVGDGGSIIRSELGTLDIFTLFFELLVARDYCVWAIIKHTCGEPCPIMHPPRPWND
jgi:dolichyl-phosphate-mannose--protein O-mannosyl transferase